MEIVAGSADCAAAIADVVANTIFVDCAAPDATSVYVQRVGEPAELLFPASTSSFGLESDGMEMAWLVYDSSSGLRRTFLWTSPHAVRADDVVARLVAELPTSEEFVATEVRVGSGFAAVLEGNDLIGVYRLSDGARAELRAPSDEQWNGFVQYIGNEEIVATSGVYTVPLSDRSLMFVELDSLDFVL